MLQEDRMLLLHQILSSLIQVACRNLLTRKFSRFGLQAPGTACSQRLEGNDPLLGTAPLNCASTMNSTDGAIIPASPPPAGVTADFVNGENIAYRLFIVAIFFPVMALLFLSIRLYSAAFILRKWRLDDGL